MITTKQYLIDSALFGPARIVEKVEAGVVIVRLDRTLFHPATLVQRGDRGRIGRAAVVSVEMNRNAIDHYIEGGENLRVGDTVIMQVDESWRLLQATYHTAGHLIMYAMQQLRRDCKNLGGRHWPDQAVVRFRTDRLLGNDEMSFLQAKLNDLIRRNLTAQPVIRRKLRYIKFGDFPPIRCSGTHLSSTGLLDRIVISRSEFEEGMLQVFFVAYQKQSKKDQLI